MGYYINEDSNGRPMGASFHEKKKSLLRDGAVPTKAERYEEDLVCLVDNGMFAAAAYVYREEEYNEYKAETRRDTEWFRYSFAKQLAK